MGRNSSITRRTTMALIVGSFLGASARAADPVPAAKAPQVLDFPDFQKQVQPFFNKYCIECHSAKGSEPDIQFDRFTDMASMEKGMPNLEKAVKMLREQKMPPKKKAQPTKEEHDAALAWLEAYTSGIDCSNPTLRTPGRVTLHRLNRAEYNNTIRDLLALDMKPANAFPADDAGYGFDNNGDVLSIAPVLMEKYISAAGQILDKAIYSDPLLPPPVQRWEAATLEGTIPPSDAKASTAARGPGGRTMPFGRVFNYSGQITTEYNFPADGEYNLRIRGYAKQRATIQFMIDGESVGKPVQLTEDIQNTKIYGPDKLPVKAGKHTVTIAFTNGSTKEEYDVLAAAAAVAAAEAAAKAATQPAVAPAAPVEEVVVNEDAAVAAPPQRAQAQGNPELAGAAPATNPAARGQRGANGARGRGAQARGARGGAAGAAAAPGGKPTMGVVFVEVEGPLEVTPDRMPESYRRIMVARPSATVTKTQAAEQIVRNFATKAYRRPL
jgi:Protein of unknown function (DUF1587)